ncbi:MAG: hypothetical protein RDU20_14580 [Desulfomonilaceae bacterium]|nr:hypothetical protein [Desulfomonilaceae bacterium]
MFFTKVFIKTMIYLVTAVLFVLSVTVLVKKHEIALLKQFYALNRIDPIPEAEKLYRAGEYCEALEYLEYFMDYDYVRTNPEVQRLYKEVKTTRNSYAFRAEDLLKGVWKGKGACPESLVSATVSDFFIVGDVRDLLKGTLDKYYYEQDPDEFVMALAGVGIVASVITYMSGGTTTPAKVSLSAVKLAERMGKLPASLRKSLTKIFREAARTGNLKPIKPMSRSLYNISRVKGLKIRDLLVILSRSRRVSDIKMMEKAAGVYGKKIGKYLKLGGQSPLKVLRKFPGDKQAARAMDSAVQYGAGGTRLLEKTGPSKFLKYVRITKYTARTTRSVWQGRLNRLLVKLFSFFPEWSLWAIAGVSGLIVVGMPTRAVVKWRTRRRERSST